jgi:hypothetical protein
MSTQFKSPIPRGRKPTLSGYERDPLSSPCVNGYLVCVGVFLSAAGIRLEIASPELRGHNLSCCCSLSEACHAGIRLAGTGKRVGIQAEV